MYRPSRRLGGPRGFTNEWLGPPDQYPSSRIHLAACGQCCGQCFALISPQTMLLALPHRLKPHQKPIKNRYKVAPKPNFALILAISPHWDLGFPHCPRSQQIGHSIAYVRPRDGGEARKDTSWPGEPQPLVCKSFGGL